MKFSRTMSPPKVMPMVVLMAGCSNVQTSRPPAATVATRAAGVLVGPTVREEIVAAEAHFSPHQASEPDADAIDSLRSVRPGARLVVVLGTWCGDSQRELSRWFRTLDAIGEPYPFAMEYLAVDRSKQGPHVDGLGIERVPTFIVLRDGEEVGRVVESAPEGIERAVLALLGVAPSATGTPGPTGE